MEEPQRRYISLREMNWWVVSGFFALVLVCLFFYRQLDFVANHRERSPLLTFSEEFVGCLSGFIIFPLTYEMAIRFPLLSKKWPRYLPLHLAAVCGISILHTTLITVLRAALFPLLHLHNDYGDMRWRYPMEFAHLFMFYWLGMAVIYLFHELRFARERELRQARLEATLAEAQLQNLRLQLEPHFLFNALNAISATIYESPRAADEMIGRLGEFLRQLLKNDRSQEVPLQREIELLQLYTGIMQARFEDRLHVEFDIDESAGNALVPQLLLQPLVENAIRHGMDPVTFRAEVTVSARLVACNEKGAQRLQLTVRDCGPGFETLPPKSAGIGLRNTRERLERLYGDGQALTWRNANGSGAVVEIELPVAK